MKRVKTLGRHDNPAIPRVFSPWCPVSEALWDRDCREIAPHDGTKDCPSCKLCVCFFFSARDIKPVQPPLPSSPIPLLNAREIQLGKKDALLTEEQNSSTKQKANPYRKSPNGKDK